MSATALEPLKRVNKAGWEQGAPPFALPPPERRGLGGGAGGEGGDRKQPPPPGPLLLPLRTKIRCHKM